MQILVGALLGCVFGVGAWLVAYHFVSLHLDQPEDDSSTQRLAAVLGARGAILVLSALTLGGMALWGAYVGWRSPGPGQAVSVLLVTGLLVAISLVDFQVRRIPNPLVLALLLWAVIQTIWLGQPTPIAAALGLLVGGGLFLLIALAGRGAMGAGDVKLAAALGAILGLPLILTGLFWGILAGGTAALVLLVTRRAARKDAMAYGPWLALGAWLAWTRSLGLWP